MPLYLKLPCLGQGCYGLKLKCTPTGSHCEHLSLACGNSLNSVDPSEGAGQAELGRTSQATACS